MICGKQVIGYEKCVLVFSTTLSAAFLILRRIKRDIITNVYWYLCKVAIILVSYNEN
jgi:hypothetical protein